MFRKAKTTHQHTPAAIAARLSKGDKHSYLRDWVYGGIDGAVTTFAVVSGVVGANLAAQTILILGIANLIADGFSMAAANYLGTKSEHDELKFWRQVETEHIEKYPEGETEETRQILAGQGFKGEQLDRAVEMFKSNKTAWLRLMLTEEYGLPQSIRNPSKSAVATFFAFVICGAIPLVPYLIGPITSGSFALSANSAFTTSSIMTALVFFGIGSMKSRWSVSSWLSSGLVTLAVGAAAAIMAYALGAYLGSLAH